ncbi:MAG: ABC transporter ATP-binding protein/permease [Oscillospiraceae bacterium]|jgi:ATP-binding cassette subfamily B protein|nr:ABC transporter ATP-binding protein/permease [Oscillospiraceae bacterium]
MRGFGPMSDEEKAEAPKITRKLVFRAFSYLKPYKFQLFVILLTILVSSVLGLLPTYLSRDVVDKGFLGANVDLVVTSSAKVGDQLKLTASTADTQYLFTLVVDPSAEVPSLETFTLEKRGTPTDSTWIFNDQEFTTHTYDLGEVRIPPNARITLVEVKSDFNSIAKGLVQSGAATKADWKLDNQDSAAAYVDNRQSGSLSLVVILIIASFIVMIISGLIGILQSYVNTWMSQHIVFDMRNQMFDHLTYMSHRFFTNEKQGDLITRMTSDVQGVNQVISGTLINLFSNLITLVTTVVAMISMNWRLTIVGILIIPILIVPTRAVGRKRFEIAGATQDAQDDMNQILNETLNVSGSLLVKLFTREKREYAKFEKTNTEIVELSIRESIVGRWFMMFMQILNQIGPTIIYLVSAVLLFKYARLDITVGSIAAMIALVQRLFGPVQSLFSMQVDITRSMALFNRLFNYYDMPIEITNKPDAIDPGTVHGTIEFEDVKFHYDSDSPILKGVSFSIKPGTTTAIVGPSGAGKSTIINLIPRLYDTISGAVKIDGVDVRDLDMFALRRNIGFVTQDTYLFNGSVRDNLLYAKEDATDAELIDACKKANIHDFIDSLPEKYDTVVGNRGLKLSGGEKQRMSIARVILKDPKILLLDEATSSLDSISETMIQAAIDPLLGGRTGVVIAHRLSTIMSADEIVVLQKGEVKGRGTHRELLATNDVYKELYETQFSRAIEDYKQSQEEQEQNGENTNLPEFMRRGGGGRPNVQGGRGGFTPPEGFDPSKFPGGPPTGYDPDNLGFDPSNFKPPEGFDPSNFPGFPGGSGGGFPGGDR